MAVTGLLDGEPVTLINIYAPSESHARREALFAQLKALGVPPGSVVLGGDCNCVLDKELDRSRVSRSEPECHQLLSLLEQWKLVDAATEAMVAVHTESDKLGFFAQQHTFRYRHGDDSLASSRLDRWYVPKPSLQRVANLEVDTPLAPSDHDAVWLVLQDEARTKRSRTGQRQHSLRYPMPKAVRDTTMLTAAAMLHEFIAFAKTLPPEECAAAWDEIKDDIRIATLWVLRADRQRVTRAYRQRKRRLRAALRAAQRRLVHPAASIPGTVPGVTQALEVLALNHHAR